MEVAGQWRREWAGTAEYGKVTEGGVTRQVARAMEVLHASAPGARVRVMRAAYHSTAGPGEPASSYMLHSSRRVISSGYNFVEPETSLSRPLEISSTPLESSPETELGNENYKVTEPDDMEISEPSKWRGSRSINSIRMPSEESSSTDNTSIIDLDNNNRSTHRKSSEKFIPQTYQKRVSPISSLLDTPITLSTLKYKSLLNGNDSWNNRRKSYSFEETPGLEENILRETDAINMESSTDSGICKSSELVNSENYNSDNVRHAERKSRMEDIHEETFNDWLSKNRKNHYTKHVQSKKEHIIGIELSDQNNITLQSTGKVSIKLPKTTKTEEYDDIKNGRTSDDYDKRTKKVEFCKTELHFAAESGTVNIIATDEKPPPSNDFRKKRSMFVPMGNNYNKSITLFGEKIGDHNKNNTSNLVIETNIIDENAAATKGILKNKIPKPKPYLLGENMVLGDSIDNNSLTSKNDTNNNNTKPTGVSLINKQLQLEKRFSNESRSSNEKESSDWSSFKKPTFRTSKIGPEHYSSANQEKEQRLTKIRNSQTEKDDKDTIKTKVKILESSPSPTRARTRQLRESDLTYFGITKRDEAPSEKRKHSLDSIYDENNLREEILHSVQLVKLISNSVGNSEVDSDEAPDYENVPFKENYIPKPVPRLRSKYHNYLDGNKEQKDLNTILEKDDDTVIAEPRRARVKKQTASITNRSLSEPPKVNRQKSNEVPHRVHIKTNETKHSPSSKRSADTIEKRQKSKNSDVKSPERRISVSPIYVNLETKSTRKMPHGENIQSLSKQNSIQRQKPDKKPIIKDDATKHTRNKTKYDADSLDKASKRRMESEKHKVDDYNSDKKKTSVNRTKILVTPEKSPGKSQETSKKHRSGERNSFREKKVINKPKEKHSSTKTEFQESDKTVHIDRNSTDVKASHPQPDVTAIKKYQKSLTDTTSTKDSLKEQKETQNSKVIVADIKMSQPKANKTEKIDKTENKHRRSKYVINYDDKNGTVSSICKIRPDHGSSRKKVVNHDNKDSFKAHSVNKNSSNKNNLLQVPDQQWNLYGNSKTKSKIRARQSCQIL